MGRAVFERGVPAHAPERRRSRTDGVDALPHDRSEGDTGMAWRDRTRERFRGGSLTAIVLIVIAVLAVIYALFLRP